jgi:hypothetical protein
VTATHRYTQMLAPDYSEDQIDVVGSRLTRESATHKGLVVVGEVRRVHDQMMVQIETSQVDGGTGVTAVPADSPLAAGREPTGRMVTWEADTEPMANPGEGFTVVGQIHGAVLSRAEVPQEITDHGGFVSFEHGLKTEDVTISAYDDHAGAVGYEFAVEVSSGKHQMLLLPGVVRLEAVAEAANIEEANE